MNLFSIILEINHYKQSWLGFYLRCFFLSLKSICYEYNHVLPHLDGISNFHTIFWKVEDKHSMSENPATEYINCGIRMTLQKLLIKLDYLKLRADTFQISQLYKNSKSLTNFSNRTLWIHEH